MRGSIRDAYNQVDARLGTDIIATSVDAFPRRKTGRFADRTTIAGKADPPV